VLANRQFIGIKRGSIESKDLTDTIGSSIQPIIPIAREQSIGVQIIQPILERGVCFVLFVKVSDKG
jgi:hypothetical protein